MCQLHAQRWERAGRPDLEAWLAVLPPVTQPMPGATCRITHCQLWPQAALPFCHTHAKTWKVNGQPEIDEFARRFDQIPVPACETIRLGQLRLQVKLELQTRLLSLRHRLPRASSPGKRSRRSSSPLRRPRTTSPVR